MRAKQRAVRRPAMATAFNPETAELVNYHGSLRRMHGEWYLAGPCICQRCTTRVLTGREARHELADVRGPERITCVRRESFTKYEDLPELPEPVEHKTRTSQPNGYQYGADGSRMSNPRGGLIRDRASWWFCTCGAKGAGATREEARSWARKHREQEAAKHQAEFQAALAALRTALGMPAEVA